MNLHLKAFRKYIQRDPDLYKAWRLGWLHARTGDPFEESKSSDAALNKADEALNTSARAMYLKVPFHNAFFIRLKKNLKNLC